MESNSTSQETTSDSAISKSERGYLWFVKTGLKQASVFLSALQALTAVGYGFRVVSEAGTDFGIYYLGGVSSSRDFELYGDFFEHKGPAYYAFIKLLAYVISFGVIGSAITLAVTAMVWFICINGALSAAKIQNVSTIVLVKLLSVSVLFAQSSNSSIFLFGSGLSILGITILMDFTLRPKYKTLLMSTVLIGLAALTKLDSLAILLPCLILTLRIKKKRLQFFTMFWVSFMVVTGSLILALSLFLPYKLKDAFFAAIEFVLTVRWNSENISATGLVFQRNLYTFLPLVTSGIILAILLVYISCINSRIRPTPLVLFSSYGFIIFLFLGSSKSYHFFDFYTFAIIGILLQAQSPVGNLKKLRYALISCLLAVSFAINLGYSQEIKCLLDELKCQTRFSSLPIEDKDFSESDYLLSQGWPYIILEKFPEVNPNVYWPLAVDTGRSSTNLIEAIRNSKKTIWFDSNDLNFIREKNPKLYETLFLRMKVVGEANDGEWIAYRNQ